MPRILWIGGPPGAGKTTVARRLARAHGLRWYNADARTWEHRDRAIAAGHPAAIRWERLSRADRWRVPPAEMLDMSLHRERGSMMAEDVAALPDSPLVVAEGTAVTPAVPAPGDLAVWLMPDAALQERRLLARGMSRGDGAFTLYRLLHAEIAAELTPHGERVLPVAVGEDADAVTARVTAAFAEALAAGPVASVAAERAGLLAEANDAIGRQFRGFYARPWAPAPDETYVCDLYCECGDRSCTADVTASPMRALGVDGHRPAVLAPGHAVP